MWKSRLQSELDNLSKDISELYRKRKGELNIEQKYRALKREYYIEKRDLKFIMKKLK